MRALVQGLKVGELSPGLAQDVPVRSGRAIHGPLWSRGQLPHLQPTGLRDLNLIRHSECRTG